MNTTAPGYIQGFIALEQQRRNDRWALRLKCFGIAALVLVGTGAVQFYPPKSKRITVDLASCPPHQDLLAPDVVSFTIAMKGDGTAEVLPCTRWRGQAKYQPRTPQ